MRNQIQEAKAKLAKKIQALPKDLLVLGSGLGGVTEEMTVDLTIPYSEIPHCRVSTVQGHHGNLLVGKFRGRPLAVMRGRIHCYEGYSAEDTVFPLRVFAGLGAERFFLTNAAGGIRPEYRVGDLALITDHINFSGMNPLIGPNEQEWGPRFPDMSHAYSPRLQSLVEAAAQAAKIPLQKGVYLMNVGPSFETPAEIRMYRQWGADLVGMSTVLETIALNHLGKEVVGISCVTNLAAGITADKITHEEVGLVGRAAQVKFAAILEQYLAKVQG